jgi:hypothetical protein
MRATSARALAAALTAAALAALVACNDSPPAATPPATEPAAIAAPPQREVTSQLALQQPEVVLPQQQAFELVNAGSGARAVLRYALAAGTTTYSVDTRLSSRTYADGSWTHATEEPALHDGFAISIGDKPGLLALRALPGQPGSPWATLLGGRRMTLALDDRGQLGALRFADDPTLTRAGSRDAYDEAMQRLLGLVVPLPEGAVGVGATWRVTTALRQSAAVVKQTATYKLTARTATRWTVHVQLRREAQPQSLGGSLQLVAIFRVLEGDIEIAPAQPLGAGKLSVESRVHARVVAAHAEAHPVDQVVEDTGTLVLGIGAGSAGSAAE